MTEFRLLDPDDTDTAARIIALSSATLLANPDISSVRTYDGEVPRLDQDKLGVSGFCMESSDAVTRAAHSLGIVAAREPLLGWHFITSFAPLDQMPTGEDLVMCRTWGQDDNELYASDHPLARRPFFGPRKDLAALLPDSRLRFDPKSVMYRRIVHKPDRSPLRRRVWLTTEPEELVRMGFVMGLSELPEPDVNAQWL